DQVVCTSAAPASTARHAFGGGVFKMQRLAGMDQREDRMRRLRRLGKPAEDELELAGICRNVADGEDAGLRALAGGGIDGNVVLHEIEAPSRDRSEIHRQAEEGQ